MPSTSDSDALIAKLKEENIRWMRMAGTNRLTDLPNSLMLFQVRLPPMLQGDTSLSCILLCPDNLGEINQAHGRIAGDGLIQQIADFLKTQVEPAEQLYHCDGANFAVLAPDSSEGHARRRANQIRGTFARKPFSVGGEKTYLTCSAGCAEIGSSATPTEEAATQLYADLCDHLYQAKNKGGNTVVGTPRRTAG